MKKSEFEHKINKLNEQTIINCNFSFFLSSLIQSITKKTIKLKAFVGNFTLNCAFHFAGPFGKRKVQKQGIKKHFTFISK